MAASMVHPYYGHLVVCAEVDPSTHPCFFAATAFAGQFFCDGCGRFGVECLVCKTVAGCCPCGLYHARTCPWPL